MGVGKGENWIGDQEKEKVGEGKKPSQWWRKTGTRVADLVFECCIHETLPFV